MIGEPVELLVPRRRATRLRRRRPSLSLSLSLLSFFLCVLIMFIARLLLPSHGRRYVHRSEITGTNQSPSLFRICALARSSDGSIDRPIDRFLARPGDQPAITIIARRDVPSRGTSVTWESSAKLPTQLRSLSSSYRYDSAKLRVLFSEQGKLVRGSKCCAV